MSSVWEKLFGNSSPANDPQGVPIPCQPGGDLSPIKPASPSKAGRARDGRSWRQRRSDAEVAEGRGRTFDSMVGATKA